VPRHKIMQSFKADVWVYLLAVVLGISAGFVDVGLGDLLLTALFVLACTMTLGLLRPDHAWRWTVIVGVFVPIVQLLAYILITEKPYRAQIYESFLAFFPGIAGTYMGAFARRGLHELFGK
jgi:hypothetical protein